MSIALALKFRDRSGKDIKGFDALRAFSVTLVILSHTGVSAMASNASSVLSSLFSVFNGNYGVRTFFVLSGFLITSLLIKEHATTGRISVPAFMARRALRILPLYFLVLGIGWLLAYYGIAEYKPTAMLFSFFYVYNFLPNIESLNYLNHLWSLAVEEQFYLFWPFVFGLLFARTRFAVNMFATTVIAACFLRMQSGYGIATASYTPSLWTIPAIHPIMIGALTATNIDRVSRYLRTCISLFVSLALIMGSLLIPYSAAWEIISTFGIAGVIAWIYLNQQNAFVQRMDWGIVGYFGTISYGLYMWQGFLTGNGPYRAVEYWPPNIWLGAALTFPAAVASFHIFERPIRKYGLIGLRMIQRKRPAPASQQAGE